MAICKTCEGNGYMTHFPIHPPMDIVNEKDNDKRKEKLLSFVEFCKSNLSYPCPDCKPLEYKIYSLELQYNKLERWFRRYIIDKRNMESSDSADEECPCVEATPQEIIREQLSIVDKIEKDEAWFEGERRKCPVCRNDPEVQKNVIKVVKEYGHVMRKDAVDKIKKRKKGAK